MSCLSIVCDESRKMQLFKICIFTIFLCGKILNNSAIKCIVSRFQMRQRVWSTDIYCQIIINFQHGQLSYLYQNRKKGKRASCRRDRERKRERDGEWLKSGGSVGCKNDHWRNRPFWDNLRI